VRGIRRGGRRNGNEGIKNKLAGVMRTERRLVRGGGY
jgi:hypothetical protein